jgi:hypothetical protein
LKSWSSCAASASPLLLELPVTVSIMLTILSWQGPRVCRVEGSGPGRPFPQRRHGAGVPVR